MVASYLFRVGASLSVLVNVLLGGELDQPFSARNYEWKRRGRPNIVWLIDKLFPYSKSHCLESWSTWMIKKEKIGGNNIRPFEMHVVHESKTTSDTIWD
jgi:hypothetical protein